MKNKTKIFRISTFESVSENSENKLVGGFSLSQSSSMNFDFSTTNNCMGGNCSTDCGSGPIGQNVQCNVAQGCGTIIKN
ncbi:hypothetical protein [Lacinutrix chionoecetis]